MKKRLAALALAFAAFSAAPAEAALPKGHFPVVRYQHSQKACAADYLLSRDRVRNPRRGFAVNTLRNSRRNCRFEKSSRTATRGAYWKLGWPEWYVRGKKGGQYGIRLHKVLLGLSARPLSYRLTAGKRAARAVRHERVDTGREARLISFSNALIRSGPSIHYTQSSSRMTIVRHHLLFPPVGTIYEDCSSAVTGLYWRVSHGAGAVFMPDPNGAIGGHYWSGWGFTGTLANHGRVVWQRGQSLDRLRIGDLILYGYYPFHHVVMYTGGGYAFSQGREYGPYKVPVLYRSDATQARRYVG